MSCEWPSGCSDHTEDTEEGDRSPLRQCHYHWRHKTSDRGDRGAGVKSILDNGGDPTHDEDKGSQQQKGVNARRKRAKGQERKGEGGGPSDDVGESWDESDDPDHPCAASNGCGDAASSVDSISPVSDPADEGIRLIQNDRS